VRRGEAENPADAADVAQILDLREERRSIDLTEEEEAVHDEVCLRAALEILDQGCSPLRRRIRLIEQAGGSDHVENVVFRRIGVIGKIQGELVVGLEQSLLGKDIQIGGSCVGPQPVARRRGALGFSDGVIRGNRCPAGRSAAAEMLTKP